MRFWHTDIRASVRRAFGRIFPERQIFLRSQGEVRFVRLSPRLQAAATTAILLILGWGLYASVRIFTGDGRLSTREAELAFASDQLDMLVREVTRLQKDALARTRQLEAQQSILKTAVGLEATQAEGGEGKEDGDGNGTAEPPDERESTSPTSAEDLERPRIEKGESFAGIRARSDHLLARIDRLTGEQRHLAALVLDRERKRIEEARRLFARLDVPASATSARSGEEIPAPAGVGGPYAPIATVSPSRYAMTEPGASQERPGLASDILPPPPSASDDLPFAPELRSLAQTLAVKRRVIDLLESLPRTKPVTHYFISSRFGPRRDPFRKRRSMHYGLDMAGWPGEPIRAVAPGVVIKAGRAPAYGLMVEIDHGNGYHTRYGHMRRLFVHQGETVVTGKRIGSMGSTGRSTSTHLHWEVWYHDRPVDPLPYLKAIADVETLRKEFERRNDGQG